jgi:hypothetical protein
MALTRKNKSFTLLPKGNYQMTTVFYKEVVIVPIAVEVDMDKVRLFMKKLDLSEYGFSRKMGVSYSYVFRVMRGKRRAGQAFISGLVRAGMNPVDIYLRKTLPKGNECKKKEDT